METVTATDTTTTTTTTPSSENKINSNRLTEPAIDEMKVQELKKTLKKVGLPVSGRKTELQNRLKDHLRSGGTQVLNESPQVLRRSTRKRPLERSKDDEPTGEPPQKKKKADDSDNTSSASEETGKKEQMDIEEPNKDVTQKEGGEIAETPKENTPKENTPKENTPKENTPKENTPKENTPKENTPKENTPKENETGQVDGSEQITRSEEFIGGDPNENAKPSDNPNDGGIDNGPVIEMHDATRNEQPESTENDHTGEIKPIEQNDAQNNNTDNNIDIQNENGQPKQNHKEPETSPNLQVEVEVDGPRETSSPDETSPTST